MKFYEALQRAASKFNNPAFIELHREEDPTMIKHFSILQQINLCGFLTTESQAGRKNGDYSERAYITGFMKTIIAQEFITRFNSLTDKNAVVIYHCDGLSRTEIPANQDLPLTVMNKDGTIVSVTHMSMVLPTDVWDGYRKEVRINKGENVVLIFCWDGQWNRAASGQHGLFTEVLETLSRGSRGNIEHNVKPQ